MRSSRVSDEWLKEQKIQESREDKIPVARKDGWPLKHLCSWCGQYDSYGEKKGDFVYEILSEKRNFLCGRCLEEIEWN